MNKILKLKFAAILFLCISSFACGDKGNDAKPKKKSNKVEITIKANAEDINIEGAIVDIIDLRSQKIVTANLNKEGEATVTIDKGTYTFSTSVFNKEENKRTTGAVENRSITKNETINISMHTIEIKNEGFLFKEIFFTGETHNNTMVHPDQYFVLVNNSDEVLYADGITFATAARGNQFPEDNLTALLPDFVVVSQMYSIPGDGTKYPVQPGEEIVIAANASNHNENNPQATDLSGADFEAFDYNDEFDIDNPNVPNLIAHYSGLGGFHINPKGFGVPLIFYTSENMSSFMAKNALETTNTEGKKTISYKVPTELIRDGIETGMTGQTKTKSLPLTVDAGFIGVSNCHTQELVVRRSATQGNKTTFFDSNNSRTDCYIQKGQNSFPKGYKNK